MKTKFLVLLALFNCVMFAQTPDPYKFFPSAVGNVWDYGYSTGIYRFEIISDSLLADSSRYLYYAPNTDPVYRVDKNYNVYWWPLDTGLNWLYYKLDADLGNYWIVDIHHIIDTFYVYKLAKVKSLYEGIFFNLYTTFKEITFYQYQPDSIINEFSWPDFTITLAYGIGEVMDFNEDGSGPYRILQGCIIDGDTIGIITSLNEPINPLSSFELFQNFPNPFNPATTIKYSITEPQKVKLIVYSLLGEKIKVLVDEHKSTGMHSVIFDAGNLSSGIYIYTLIAGNKTSSKKLILLK
ncbi:MAG: hypothetical protein BroJett005_22270 [Ignavibacteriota bacterium]|nr:MAG: hypothetical protein BroJett005_22270 [Ignavibacteriota bacterium]